MIEEYKADQILHVIRKKGFTMQYKEMQIFERIGVKYF